MKRVRIGVIGAGGIVQVEHIPNLMALRDRFTVAGIFDPSPTARTFVAQRYGLDALATLDDLLSQPLDAVLVATPDALHKEQVLNALTRGLHVFCEKPLCYGPGDVAELVAARDAAQRVLQVGYMKRFDPSYEAALRHLPGTAATLRHVSVEVSDPDAWPFVRHHHTVRTDDVPPDLRAETQRRQREQASRAVGRPLDDLAYRGFCGAYCSALVHDVNAVHGLLDAMGVPAGEVVGAQIFANGDGGHGSLRLLDGQALWTMTHLSVPGLPDYRERITLYFDDAALELEFPSPYLNHQATRLTVKTAKDHVLHCTDIHSGYAEAFVEELKGFWEAVVEGQPVRNTAEQAGRDMALLCDLARRHIDSSPATHSSGATA